MTNLVLQLLAVAIVTWLLLLVPMREPTRTAIVVIAVLIAVVCVLRTLFPGALAGL